MMYNFCTYLYFFRTQNIFLKYDRMKYEISAWLVSIKMLQTIEL